MSDKHKFPAREVLCPACKGPSRYASDNPYRPFCCARCKNVDLGAWANEEFKLASPPVLDDDPDAPPPLLQ